MQFDVSIIWLVLLLQIVLRSFDEEKAANADGKCVHLKWIMIEAGTWNDKHKNTYTHTRSHSQSQTMSKEPTKS